MDVMSPILQKLFRNKLPVKLYGRHLESRNYLLNMLQALRIKTKSTHVLTIGVFVQHNPIPTCSFCIINLFKKNDFTIFCNIVNKHEYI